jgi:hypothetical protein
MLKLPSHHLFFLEHAGELLIIILRRKKEGQGPRYTRFYLFDREEKPGKKLPNTPTSSPNKLKSHP